MCTTSCSSWNKMPALILLAALGIVFATFSVIYGRSLIATFVEWYLRLTEKKYTDEEVIAGLPELALKTEVEYSVPERYARKMRVEKTVLDGMQTFTFYGSNETKTAVIYLHGAGYVRPPRKQHWRFAYRLARRTKSTVIFAIYPKAPTHVFDESYKILTKLYLDTRKKYQKVFLSGDSSGGGLAAGLAEDFLMKDIPQPDALVLLSPWLDITLSHPAIPAYEKKDPIVCVSNDRIWGEAWAKGTDLKDYRVSPFYGKVKGLAPTYLFVGTREALYPDAIEFAGKLAKEDVFIRVFIGQGMNHVYPIYPIPEAGKALKQIAEIIDHQ